MEQQSPQDRPRGGVWNQIQQYLFLKKRDKREPRNANIFLMHGMNRISILIFLIALIIIIFRMLTKGGH